MLHCKLLLQQENTDSDWIKNVFCYCNIIYFGTSNIFNFYFKVQELIEKSSDPKVCFGFHIIPLLLFFYIRCDYDFIGMVLTMQVHVDLVPLRDKPSIKHVGHALTKKSQYIGLFLLMR